MFFHTFLYYGKITRPQCCVKRDKLFFVYDLFYQTQTKHFLNDAMAISANEMPKNHTDKAAASSCFATGD